MFQATLGQHKGLGVAAKKKDARKEAAKDLLEKLEEKGISLSAGMKSKTANIKAGGGNCEEETTVVAVSNKQLWTKCLKLLPTDDEDFVKQLKIFSLNSNTGLPKYQVSNNILKDKDWTFLPQVNNTGGKEGLIEVFCTWNKFFLSARAEEKSDAEQNAARATLNKVRIIFGD